MGVHEMKEKDKEKQRENWNQRVVFLREEMSTARNRTMP